MDREDIKMLVKKWWDIYEDEALDLKKPAPENLILQPFMAALSEAAEADMADHRSAPSAA